MKQKNLIYLAAAALAIYLITRKKKPMEVVTSKAKDIINEAARTATDIIDTIPALPVMEAPAQPVMEVLSSPPQFTKDFTPEPKVFSLPFDISQSELVDYPQISPSPASVLSPRQLQQFNQALVKGQLMGVC